jgi:peptide/nickel transport system permease protein
MFRLLVRRLLLLVPTALFGSVLIFAMVQIIPGGAAETIAGEDASPQTIERIRTQLGLDRPLHEQYVSWLDGILHGDFGRALLDNRPIGEDIAVRLPHTLELATSALGVALLIGLPLGIASAIYRTTLIDNAITNLSGIALAVPEFWMAMIAINLFAIDWAWLPATGLEPWSAGWQAHVTSMIMPVLTLSTGAAAVITRFTRSGMIQALDSPYIRTARSLGLPPVTIHLRFALKNALVPVITISGIIAGALLGGAVLVEQVFVIPGLGAMLVTGVLQKDYPVVQGVALVLTVAVILINLVVDLACGLLDPRGRS